MSDTNVGPYKISATVVPIIQVLIVRKDQRGNEVILPLYWTEDGVVLTPDKSDELTRVQKELLVIKDLHLEEKRKVSELEKALAKWTTKPVKKIARRPRYAIHFLANDVSDGKYLTLCQREVTGNRVTLDLSKVSCKLCMVTNAWSQLVREKSQKEPK